MKGNKAAVDSRLMDSEKNFSQDSVSLNSDQQNFVEKVSAAKAWQSTELFFGEMLLPGCFADVVHFRVLKGSDLKFGSSEVCLKHGEANHGVYTAYINI